MIAAIALGIVAAVAMTLRRRQERSILLDWAARHGWTLIEDGRELYARLTDAALMQIGHSRRFSAIARDPQGVTVFEYGCETGFEHTREQHRWIGVWIPTAHRHRRAAISREAWVLAAAARPFLERREIAVADKGHDSRSIALVEDPLEWESPPAELSGKLTSEPPRSWEILLDSVLGYQPATDDEAGISGIVSAAKEVAVLL